MRTRRWGKPASGTWWTESGSRRPLRDAVALEDTTLYVLQGQEKPLVVWPELGQGAKESSGG